MTSTGEIAIVSSRPEVRARWRSIPLPPGVAVVESDPGIKLLSRPRLQAIVVDLTADEGMNLIRAASSSRPEVRLLAIGYPPAPEQVEEATRLGVDRFLPTDGSDAAMHAALAQALEGGDDPGRSYSAHVEQAKASLREHRVRSAEAHARRALAVDPDRPDAYNLLGVVREATSHRDIALRFYRFALELDPSHELARRNLTSASKPPTQRGPVEFE
jgi:DNA-binding NarL/FixJ family response regulator